MSETPKAREWWINDNAECDNTLSASRTEWFGYVHVREVIPGSIQITRGQLREAFAKALCVNSADGWSTGIAIERELFGNEK